jgi:hypothetical protein
LHIFLITAVQGKPETPENTAEVHERAIDLVSGKGIIFEK